MKSDGFFKVLFRRPQKYDEISQLFLTLLCKFKKVRRFRMFSGLPRIYELKKGIICIQLRYVIVTNATLRTTQLDRVIKYDVWR